MWRTVVHDDLRYGMASHAAHAQCLGYAIAGLTANSGGFGGLALHAGGGGEFLTRGVGVGAELGLLTNGGSALGVLSLRLRPLVWRWITPSDRQLCRLRALRMIITRYTRARPNTSGSQ